MKSLFLVALSSFATPSVAQSALSNKVFDFRSSRNALPPHTEVTLLTKVDCKNRQDVETRISALPCYMKLNSHTLNRASESVGPEYSQSYLSKEKQYIDIKIVIDGKLRVRVEQLSFSKPDSTMYSCMKKELELGRQIQNLKMLGDCKVHQKIGLSSKDNDEDLRKLERKMIPIIMDDQD